MHAFRAAWAGQPAPVSPGSRFLRGLRGVIGGEHPQGIPWSEGRTRFGLFFPNSWRLT